MSWADNIPEGGVLCWVSDSDKIKSSITEIVVKTDKDGWFVTLSGCIFKYAAPLTPQEWWSFAPWNYDMDRCPASNVFLTLDDGYVGEGYKSANGIDCFMSAAQERVTNAIAWLSLPEQSK